ncbi:hypothetical protein BDA99DRAFT_561079 [Phascolomyces articulosus]|uniref:Uncharacterized protein n=1 Tax=Phascolomyces articulosus TaxID=60185 RepID=A0AAD5K860_9FUNG|nr:hypothetical protein BDA99DRAFT_561079 [Phascolomyces articulosus]
MLDRKEQQQRQQRRQEKRKNIKKLTIVTGSPSLNPVFKHMDSHNEDQKHSQQNQHETQQKKDIKRKKLTQQEECHHEDKKEKNMNDRIDSRYHHLENDNKNDDHDNNSNVDENNNDDASLLSAQAQRCLVMRRITYIVVVNAVTPILLYYILKPYLAPVWALVLSSTPTIISVLIQATFLRHIDTIGIASICGFLVSIILAVANGDPKLMLMRESLITAGVGAICALSLLPIRIGSFELKPIMYYLAKDLVPLKPVYIVQQKKQDHKGKERKKINEKNDDQEKFNDDDEVEEEIVALQPRILFYWRNSRFCQLHIRLLTAIDIVLLELEFGLKLFYIFSFDIDTVVIASSATWGTIGALISVFTICYSVRILKRLKQDEPHMFSTAGVTTTFTPTT